MLVVQDEPESRYAVAEVLRSAGLTVTATDMASGRARLAAGIFDLLVCDLPPARDDGLQMLRLARRLAPGAALIALSGSGLADSAGQRATARRLGVAAVLHKPFEIDTLITVARRVLAGRRHGDAMPPRGARA